MTTHIATSPLTGRIHQGRVSKDGRSFVGEKKDVTSQVLGAVIEKAQFHGGTFEIEGGGKKWAVTVNQGDSGMKTKHTGGPAFPVPGWKDDADFNGMPLRDYFAAKAMQAVPMQQGHLHDIPECYARIAQHAYKMADAMLEARK